MWGRKTGPNLLDTAEVAAFFERLDHLSEVQLLGLRATWRSTSREAHEEAWAAVRAVGDRDDLSKEIDRIRNRALAWSRRGSNTIPYRISDDITWQQIKGEAGEAVVDAALAIALGDRLEAGPRKTLLEPWLRTTQG